MKDVKIRTNPVEHKNPRKEGQDHQKFSNPKDNMNNYHTTSLTLANQDTSPQKPLAIPTAPIHHALRQLTFIHPQLPTPA